MRVVVPGEADAAVDLHRMDRGLHIGVAGQSFGEMGISHRVVIAVIH